MKLPAAVTLAFTQLGSRQTGRARARAAPWSCCRFRGAVRLSDNDPPANLTPTLGAEQDLDRLYWHPMIRGYAGIAISWARASLS
jgi:hypothetical protein